MSDVGRAYFLIAAAFGIVLVLVLLTVVWMREQVKKDLWQRGLTPVRVRWVPYAYWASVYSTAFSVCYTDQNGRVSRARCCTSTLGPTRVRWVPEDVRYLMTNVGSFGQLILTSIALFLLQFAVRAMLRAELILPASYRYRQPVHVHGWPLTLLCLAALCGAGSLLAQVIFQHDRRNRERTYTLLARGSSLLGWTLLWSSLALHAWQTFHRN
jgi:hypothetical protein